MVQAFRRFDIENNFNAASGTGVLLEWVIERTIIDRGPWKFTVQRSKRPDGDWIDITTVVDQSWAYDTERTQLGYDISNYYRVVLTTGDNNTYISDVELSGTAFDSARDWAIFKEIIRKHTDHITKRTGTRGWLLRYPTFGEASDNVDPNTGEPLDSENPSDFGTGFVGGYLPPIKAYAFLQPGKRLTKMTPSGPINAVQTTADVLAFPRFQSQDIWVNGITDERWRVGEDITTTSAVKGVPIQQNLNLTKIPSDKVIYRIKVPRG